MLSLYIARRIEHFLHAGAALGPFVGYDHDITGLDTVAENGLDSLVLRFEHAGGTRETEYGTVDTGGLDHTPVRGDVAAEHRQTAVGRIGMGHVAYAAAGAVEVEFGIADG